MARKILVVDDEKLIVKGIRFSLEQEGYSVDTAYDGEEAIRLASENSYDAILLDVMLPKCSGFEVCQQVREFSSVPIIMLTAKGDDMDKILGLDYGADDYITKPFNILEVKARLKAIFRRTGAAPVHAQQDSREDRDRIISINGLRLDRQNRHLSVNGNEINLTSREFDVLELLASNPGTVYSRDKLLKLIWGENYSGDARTVDVHVRRLREKIEVSPSNPTYVHTKWGVGYYFQG